MFVTEDLTAKTTVMKRCVKTINLMKSINIFLTTAKMHSSCKYLSLILGGINLTDLGNPWYSYSPIDFEGTLTGTEPCSSNNCELNTIMRVKTLGVRNKIGLELSFSSNPNRDQLENTPLFHRYIHPHFQGFRFKSKFTSVCNQYISERF